MRRHSYLLDFVADMELNERIFSGEADEQKDIPSVLSQMDDLLDPSNPMKIIYRAMLTRRALPRLSAEEIDRMKQLYWQLEKAGGSGMSYLLVEVLRQLAILQEASLVPFWQELFSFSRPRDRFAKERKNLALSALAFMACNKGTPEAWSVLFDVVKTHPQPEIRALAIITIEEAYALAEQKISDEFAHILSEAAVKEKAFLPRFQARRVLLFNEFPVPLDNPAGVYRFKVTMPGLKEFALVIDLRSDQTLDHLCDAILTALDWDFDHLYSFYMNGGRFDTDYEIAASSDQFTILTDELADGNTGTDQETAASSDEMVFGDIDMDYEMALASEEDTLLTDEMAIGNIGLLKKTKFLFLYDYGDENLFNIETVAVLPAAEEGEFPRLVESRGEAPEQYLGLEDEDEEFLFGEDDEDL